MSRRKSSPGWKTFPSKDPPLFTPKDRLVKLDSVTSSQANVTCTLQAYRTKWGIANSPYPANVCLLYLHLGFWQPRECQLRMASAEMIFETPGVPERRPIVIDCTPQGMFGEAYQEEIETGVEVAPRIEVQGFGAEILNYKKDKKYTRSSRWSFALQSQPDERNGYNRLVWRWENQSKGLDTAPDRSIIAAVVLDHDHMPFTVSAQISMKHTTTLRNGPRRLRNWMVIPTAGPRMTFMPERSQTPLDLTAEIEALRKTIEEENKGLAPTEYRNFRPLHSSS